MPLANRTCWCELLDFDSALCDVVGAIVDRGRFRHTNPENMRRLRVELTGVLLNHYQRSKIKNLVDAILERADAAR